MSHSGRCIGLQTSFLLYPPTPGFLCSCCVSVTFSGPSFPSLLGGVEMGYFLHSSNKIFVKTIGGC